MLFGPRQWRGLLNAAFPDRALEEACRERRRHIGLRVERSGGLAADRDVVLVSAERLDVAPYPFHRELLIQKAIVAKEMTFGVERGMGDEAKEAEAVIDGDDDDFPSGGELGAVIAVAGAVNVAAAMNPEDDGQFLVFRGIDIRGSRC